MVRLGVTYKLKNLDQVYTFQFQYGAIGSSGLRPGEYLFSCFNSSMVRLGAPHWYPVIMRRQVSIPVWCDWELPIIHCPAGTIISFNSSMVRLGVSVRGK